MGKRVEFIPFGNRTLLVTRLQFDHYWNLPKSERPKYARSLYMKRLKGAMKKGLNR